MDPIGKGTVAAIGRVNDVFYPDQRYSYAPFAPTFFPPERGENRAINLFLTYLVLSSSTATDIKANYESLAPRVVSGLDRSDVSLAQRQAEIKEWNAAIADFNRRTRKELGFSDAPILKPIDPNTLDIAQDGNGVAPVPGGGGPTPPSEAETRRIKSVFVQVTAEYNDIFVTLDENVYEFNEAVVSENASINETEIRDAYALVEKTTYSPPRELDRENLLKALVARRRDQAAAVQAYRAAVFAYLTKIRRFYATNADLTRTAGEIEVAFDR